MSVRLDLEYGGLIMTKDCTFYNAYLLIIDSDEKCIDVSDCNGFLIGMIYYDDISDVTMNKYDSTGRLTGDIIDIVRGGDLVL